ncbi:MAG: EF-P lysine aminoacylase GenX [Candidatus Magasanikbacteria bacterium]|nr:EF-P lysine aminoacylase GenX [Candidatus Magasanikbacteria bacterium]
MSNWSELKNNPRLKKIYNTRIEIIKLIREFFWSQNFVETDTPIAVKLASQEPYLNPLPITIHDPYGKAENFYLRTSPEYSLKKLLAAGYEKIFEIGKCFRDYESFGGNHNTEFTMLEWYRAPGTYQEIMDDTENLFRFIGEKLNVNSLTYKDKTVSISAAWDRLSVKEVWQQFIGVNLDNYLETDKLAELAQSKGCTVSKEDAYEDIFYKIFLNEIEPHLGVAKPVFIYDYPVQMTSLSRLCEYDNRYAERFELYMGGLEVANAFGELTDATEQEKKLEEDKEKRKQLGKPVWPVDKDFIAALKSGMAPAGGIALGVDRMVGLFTGAKDINEVIFQSVNDQRT